MSNSAQDLLLGIDIGTTAVKAVVFDVAGRVQHVAQQEYPTQYIRPGWVEQQPGDWWQATCDALQSIMQPKIAQRIAGIAVSAQAPTMLPLDSTGTPLRPAMIWMDRRAEAQAKQLGDEFGAERVFDITGNRPDPYYVAAKIMWFAQHEPDKLAQTHQFVQINGYINYRLTGAYSLDNVHGGLLQLIDQQTGAWSNVLMDACGVTPEQFPAPQPGYKVCGEVTPEAATETGLHAGTPVMVGTVDGAAAALEAGVIAPGIVAEMTGTSTVMMMPSRERHTDISLIAIPHALDNLHLLLGAMVASGASLRWYRDQFGADEMHLGERLKLDAYDLLTQQAAQVPVGSEGVIFLPYMMGERSPIWDSHARGVFFGLTLATPKAALIRAILEGVAFGMRHNIEVAQQAGVTVSEVRAVGGGSQSALWNQIKADVLGLPVKLPETSVGAPFGDAILAGLGVGAYKDAAAVIRDTVHIREKYTPNPDTHAAYSAIYPVFRSLYEHLKPDFEQAAAVFDDLS